jgi:septum formation inhibitor MinC
LDLQIAILEEIMVLKFLSLAALLALPAAAAAQVTGSRVNPGVNTGAEETTRETVRKAEETADQAVADARAEAAAEAPAGTAPAATAAQVTAATAADIRAGISVRDPQGGLVGTVESVDAEGAVVSTGSVRAKLPMASFGKNEQGLVISLTKAEFEAAARAQSPS